jgi:VanZ family protein
LIDKKYHTAIAMGPIGTSKKYRTLVRTTLALLFILFFIGGPEYQSPRSFQAIWNLGHIIFFALLPLMIFSFQNKKEVKPTTQAAIVIGITLIFGIAVELFQYGSNRTPDIGDLTRNMIGAMVAIFFLLPIRKALSRTPLLIMKSITVTLIFAQLYPIAIALLDEHHARRDFPILSDFQTPYQIQRWSQSDIISTRHIPNSPENWALKANLTTEQYSGVSLKHFPGKWLNYQWLQFRVYNPSTEPITLTCRIHDKKHTQGLQQYRDRFNNTYPMTQGWNTITINLKNVQQAPATRTMDLSNIYGIGIFATRLPHPRTIYIDDLKLLKRVPVAEQKNGAGKTPKAPF